MMKALEKKFKNASEYESSKLDDSNDSTVS